MRDVRGSDWVRPGREAVVGAVARDAAVAVSAVDAGRTVAAVAGGASGRARAAAQVTPIEEASNPRMALILDRPIRIRISRN
ncbi:hypothetical protein ALMP_03090 [Streptomyces sp. A012304]|nr:hypothetical protein ALMP_03090 [Streptomyces sp. A012304]